MRFRTLRVRNAFLVLSAALAAIACSQIAVTSDYDPATNFATYKTYDWIPTPQRPGGDPRLETPFLATRIREAVNAQMEARGYRKRESEPPDLLIAYHVAIQGKLDISTVPASYGYGYRGARAGVATTTVRPYEEGTLVLDMIDGPTRQLIWRGAAQAEVKESATPEERQARINEAVHKLLEQFPPKPESRPH